MVINHHQSQKWSSYLQQLLKVGTAGEQDQFVGTDLFALARKGNVHQVVLLPQAFKLPGHVLLEVVPLQVEEVAVVVARPIIQVVAGHRDCFLSGRLGRKI